MSDKPPVILVAEDDKSSGLLFSKLARQGYVVQSSGNAAGLWKFIESGAAIY